MKALVFTRYGGIDMLKFEDVEIPVPKENEVLIKVHAASVNDWDTGMVAGRPLFTRIFTGLFKPKEKVQIPGCDVSGIIEAVGSSVERFRVGDEVFGDLCVSGFGAFAEYVCATESALEIKSENMSFAQAASMPQAGQLAIDGLIDIGQLKAGQKLLINGAGGGVGTFGLQMAKQTGAEVTVVDSAIKLDMLRQLGADHVIDYEEQDFTRNGKHYDLILDTRTNRSMKAYTRVLAEKGLYATVGGSMVRIFQGMFWRRWIRMTSSKDVRLVAQKPNNGLAYLNELFESGVMKPVIDGPYKFAEAHQALRHFEKAEHKGKVIIAMVDA